MTLIPRFYVEMVLEDILYLLLAPHGQFYVYLPPQQMST